MGTLTLNLSHKARLELRLHSPVDTVRKAALGELIDGNQWTLTEYLAWLNRDKDGVMLTEDLDHWKEYGITKASELGDYLDGCVMREREKEAMYA